MSGMKRTEKDNYIIEKYKEDEKMMILIFAQWCINHDMDALQLYRTAYPEQTENKALLDSMEKTVPKEESEEISLEAVQQVLQLFGNDDLAFVMQQAAEEQGKQK